MAARDYVVRLAGDALDAASLDQRDLQRFVRLPYLGRRRVLHLEPQQPRLPADAVDERSGVQPARARRSTFIDHASRKVFSPFAAVARDGSATYEARHSQGVSTFTARRGTLQLELTQLVDPSRPGEGLADEDPQYRPLAGEAHRLWLCRMAARQLSPALGAEHRAVAGCQKTGALLARNPYSLDFADRVRLPGERSGTAVGHDGPRRISRLGRLGRMAGRPPWPGPPCPAGSRPVSIPARRWRARSRSLPGGERNPALAAGRRRLRRRRRARLVARHRARDFDERLAENEQNWRGFLDTLQVETPDKALDAMVNHWLPYQSIACRIRARSAFYQASGAFGFRDQLQDTLAFVLHDPKLAAGADPQRRRPAIPRKATSSIGGCRAPARACAR